MEELKRTFKYINKQYFNNTLPEVPIIVKDRKVKIIQGYLTFGDDKRTKPEIIIYSCHLKDEEILIHEMQHLEQWVKKLPIRHDKQFLKREKQINAHYKEHRFKTE